MSDQLEKLSAFAKAEGSELGEFLTVLIQLAEMGPSYGMSDAFDDSVFKEVAFQLSYLEENYEIAEEEYQTYHKSTYLKEKE